MLENLRRRVRRGLAEFGQHRLAPASLRRHARPRCAVQDPTVHLLVSGRTWDAGLLAACAFEHHTGRRWKFFVHEDGTVGTEARKRWSEILPDARLIPRSESDGKLAEVLRSHPRCLAQRSQHNLFLKFADFAAFAPGDRLIVLDSDVIFFRRPVEILDWVDSGSDTCRYNEDTKEKYCIPRHYIEAALRVKMWPRFNSGLVLLPKQAVSWDLAESLLTAFESNAHHPQFFEQTLYGLMASAWERGGALPPTYEISWGYFHQRGAVCRHYVGDFKHDLLYIEGALLLLASVFRKRSRVL